MKGIADAVQEALSKSGKAPEDLRELVLDGKCHANRLGTSLTSLSGLETLSLGCVGITSLEGFPTLKQLTQLNLSDNQIRGGLEHLAPLTALTSLDLAGTLIPSVDKLKPLSGLKELRVLNLLACPLTEKPGHAQQVFDMLQQVEWLDSVDRAGNERDNDEESDEYEEEDEQGDEPQGGGDGGNEGAEDEEEGSDEQGEEEEDDDGDDEAEYEVEADVPAAPAPEVGDYSALIGDAPLEDDPEDYDEEDDEDDGAGEEFGEEGEEDDDEDEDDDEASAGPPAGLKRKRPAEQEEEEEEEEDDEDEEDDDE